MLSLCLLPAKVVSGSERCSFDADHKGTVAAMSDRIKEGIEQVVHIVSPRFDAHVQSYLRTYLERNVSRTEAMIGRAALYFPIFEEELRASGLPEDLKYIAIIESALTPHALSRAGALGLWQFMRPTARECGLHISRYIDERCDPVKSTRAAILYFDKLYKEFGSWELAMAAYNAGPGRVRYAIRRSGSRDYWKLRAYLPRETQSYVPGFIAASYLMNYYHEHNLTPQLPDADLLETETVVVYDQLTFETIRQVTGLASDVIRLLNPIYTRRMIPASTTGYALVLPAHTMIAMHHYLQDGDAAAAGLTFYPIETGVELKFELRTVEHSYDVQSGDNLFQLARKFNCTVEELKRWNRLNSDMIRIGQRLKIVTTERILVRTDVAETAVPPETRNAETVPALNLLRLHPVMQRATQRVIPTHESMPVIKSVTAIDSEVISLRRRMSVGEMGATIAPGDTPVLPGRRLVRN